MTVSSGNNPIAFVELYVADTAEALDAFTHAFAFTAVAHAEHADRRSVLLASGSSRLIVTEPRGGHGAVAEWLDTHGDGVSDIALYRPDVDRVIERARQTTLPVLPCLDPFTGSVHARVVGFGEVSHTLLRSQAETGLPPGSTGSSWAPLRNPPRPP